MNIEELKKSVETDLSWNMTNCTEVSVGLPLIKSKYCSILYDLEIQLKAKEIQLEQLYGELFIEYATGNKTNIIIDRRDIPIFIRKEKEYIKMQLDVEVFRSKFKYLEGVLKSIDSMSFSINSAIKWEMYQNGCF